MKQTEGFPVRVKSRTELEVENANLRHKVRNYRVSMKQLQRAHVVRLYELNRAKLAANDGAVIVNHYVAELIRQKEEIAELTNRLAQVRAAKGKNGAA